MGYFSRQDNDLRERGIVTPCLRRTRHAAAYWRGRQLVCPPCSDSEDRARPAAPGPRARCSVCDQPIF